MDYKLKFKLKSFLNKRSLLLNKTVKIVTDNVFEKAKRDSVYDFKYLKRSSINKKRNLMN